MELTGYGAYLMQERHASENTVAAYLRDVGQFAEYLAGQGKELTEADGETVREYMEWMQNRGKSAASVSRYLASVKSYYNFLVAQGTIDSNPAKGVAAAWNSPAAWTPKGFGITRCWNCFTPLASASVN